MNISITSNIDAVLDEFKGIQEKSIPYAVSQAMNDVLFDMRTTELPREIKDIFDRPTTYTTGATAWDVTKAAKGNLSGSIQMRPDQARFMQFQIFGGEELPKGSSIPIPEGDQVAPHGGLKRNWKNIIGKNKSFVGVPKGHANAPGGVWVRVGKQYIKKKKGQKGQHSGTIALKLAFVKKTHYKIKWNFNEKSGSYFVAKFPDAFRIRLQQQLDHKSSS